MANRDLTIRIDADPSGAVRGFKSAQQSASVFERELKKVEAQQAKQHKAMADMGKVGMAAGAALAAGLGLSVKAAVSWESAFAGVAKTVDGTASQMSKLEGELRQLARTGSASHTEVAAVAEAAGQLGIARDDVLEFTKVMIDLGETTNLTADEAATAIARFSNIMGTASADVDRIGATLVDLGNNAATTEAEILTLGTRLAAAGKIAGLSEAEVFAFASTLTSVGVEAEAGGSAMSKVFIKVRDSVLTGGDALDTFAKTAGMTADEFKSAYGRDAAGAISSFVSGLGRINESGQSTTQVFKDLELSDQRLMRALLSTAGAGELLNDQLAISRDAWAANSALAEEAAKRYATTEARMKVAKNAVIDLGIGLGEVLLPALLAVTEGIADFASFMAGLPEPVQAALVIVASLGATIGIVGGAALIAVPRFAAMKVAMDTLGISAGRSAVAMTTLGVAMKTLGIGAAFAGAFLAVDQLIKVMADAPPTINEFNSSMQDFAATGQVTGALAKVVGKDFSDLAETMDRASQSKWFSTDFGTTSSDIQEAKEKIEGLDKALAGLVASGQGDVAAKLFGQMAAEVAASGGSVDELNASFKNYGDALVGAEVEQKRLANGMGEVAGAADEQADSLIDLMKAVKGLSDLVLGLRDAHRAYESSLDAATEALKENGKTLDISTEKGRANEAALDGIAAAAGRVLEEMVANGAPISEVTAKFEQQREKLVQNARAFGMTKDAAEAFAASVLRIPDKAETQVVLTGAEAALEQVRRLREYLGGLPSSKTVSVRVDEVQGITVSRGSGRVTERAAGGYISGPGTGTSDSIPALLSNGEYVIRASSVAKVGRAALDRINRFANGGPVGFAAGGSVSASMPVSLTTATRGLTSVGEINALVKAWQDYNRELEQAARRRDLVSDAQAAARELAAAKGTEDRAQAQERLNVANQAVKDFDYAAAREREASAVERQVKALQTQAEVQDNMYAVGVLSAQEYLAILERRMDAEVLYSDAWAALWREREGILAEQLTAEREHTKALKDEYDDRLSAVNALLDERDRVQEQIDRSTAAHQDAQDRLAQRGTAMDRQFAQDQSDLRDRQAKAERDHLTRMGSLAEQFTADQARILAERRDQLANSTALDQAVDFRRGLPADWLIANAKQQVEALSEWMEQLDLARKMGVSEEVIAALGLDDGPQALAQVKALTRASADEIDALNRTVEDRTRLAGEQVRREQVGNYGQLGEQLVASQETYASAVLAAQADYRSGQEQFAADMTALQERYTEDREALADEAAKMQQDFLAEQRVLSEQMAAIGTDQGRSYGQAMAEAMASQIPAVIAAAEALALAAGGLPPAPVTGGLPVGRQRERRGIRMQTYDSGGWLQPGYTLAYNGTGSPERVLTAGQAGGRTVNLTIDGLTIRESVDVDLLARRAEFLIAAGSM